MEFEGWLKNIISDLCYNLLYCALAAPEVEFEKDNFSGEMTENSAVPVCLSYTNTDGGFAQFSVNVSVTTQGIYNYYYLVLELFLEPFLAINTFIKGFLSYALSFCICCNTCSC